jgi:hypothetical protein
MNSERNIISKLRESKKVNESRKAERHDLIGMNQNGRRVMVQGTVKRATPGTKIWIDANPPYTYKGNNMWVYGPGKHEMKSSEVAFDLGFHALRGAILYVER